jgi:hypothetical protein
MKVPVMIYSMKHKDIIRVRTKEFFKCNKGSGFIMNFCKFFCSEALSAFPTQIPTDPAAKESNQCGSMWTRIRNTEEEKKNSEL